MNKVIGVLVIVLASLLTVSAQTALDGFDPNVNGTVNVVVVQPDGKILVGGQFTTVAGVARNNIARLNTDGTLDTAFDPNANNAILAIAVQSDGKVLASGVFTNIGGQARVDLARLDPTTGLADSWNPNAGNIVYSIAVQPDGKILAGGTFVTIGGQSRNRIARLDATTALADSWNPNSNGEVDTITLQPDGKVLTGGNFTSIGGQTRTRLARLDAATGLADSWDPNSNNFVYAIVVQADGKILAGGQFTNIGGQTRNRIARLDGVTGLADSWNPNAGNIVTSIAVQTDGKILAGGQFTTIGGQVRSRIGRLDIVTGTADSFNPTAANTVQSVAVQPDGKVVAGGLFTTIGGLTRNNIARLERDGGLDQTLNIALLPAVQFSATIYAIAVQNDGKILIGGTFTSVLGVARNNIARLNADGTLDTGFNPNSDAEVDCIAVQSDGKVLVGGFFANIGGAARNMIARLDATTGAADSWNPTGVGAANNVFVITLQPDGKVLVGGTFSGMGGQTRNRIARLDPTTGLADSWNPNATNTVRAISVQSDGKILVGGLFNGAASIGGQTRNRIARLDATTGLADSFDPNSPGLVRTIVVQPDGKILVGGQFNGVIGGQTRARIARLDPTTGLADSFNPAPNSTIYSIVAQSDGKILVSGLFNGAGSIGGQTRNFIARLDGTTGLADSWDPNADGTVNAISVRPDGKVLIGGDFLNVGGQARNFFARLTNDTAALSTLTVTKISLTLTRDGSAPQFRRVVFEQSVNNGASYTTLGTATNSFASPAGNAKGENSLVPLANGYTLNGLFLPTTQNVLIRARGFYRSGYQGGSESNEEKVQIAFLPGPSAANVSVSGRVLTANGNGIRNAIVQLTDPQGVTRTALTGSFGYYRFDDVEAGQAYVVGVASKRYVFSPRTVSVSDELTEFDLAAQPEF